MRRNSQSGHPGVSLFLTEIKISILFGNINFPLIAIHPNCQFMKSPSLLCAASLLILGTLSTQAGTALPPVPPTAEPDPAFAAEVSLGYDTFYIFRGEELFEQVVWGQVKISYNLTEKLNFTLTPWYLQGLNDPYTELDIVPTLTYDAGFAELTLGYAGYLYPRGGFGGGEGISNEHEVTFHIAKTLGIVEASTLAAYNFDREGTYLEARLGASIEFCKAAALEPSVTVGYSSNYFAGDGFTHVLLTLALPMNLAENFTLTPYIAGNLPLDVLKESQDAQLFGGLALAFGF
jgi:hypothetical protein